MAAAGLGLARPAMARPEERDSEAANTGSERPIGALELGIGWLTLPAAEVCVERDGAGCQRGDSSFALEAWQLFRLSQSFALGAGILLGLTPVADAPRRDPEGIERDHTRRYFTAETAARYYPYVGDSLEAWVGANGGLVVVSDRFTVATRLDDDRALVGSRGVTIRTEGVTLGLGGGVDYEFARNWLVGGSLRFAGWILPSEPETNSFGDEASLVGFNAAMMVSATVAYRLPL